MGRYTSGGVGRDVLAGAIAGGAAVWLISKMDWSLSHAGQKQSPSGMDPAHAAAGKAAAAAGVRVGNPRDNAAGLTVHYGIGIGAGALYGLLRGFAPAVATGHGSLYGIANFILGDEIGAPAMGLAKGPMDYPARDHAKSAVAHIVFGVLTDLGARLLAPWRNEVIIEHGPPLSERLDHGRQALADGRDYLYEHGRNYLDRGRELAGDYAEYARDAVDDWDLPALAKRGRKKARKLTEKFRSELPDADDLHDTVEDGRKRARDLARRASKRLPDRDDLVDAVDEGRSRARGWLSTLADLLPGRDDVETLTEQGRARARKLAKEARRRVPDRDDVEDAVADGRKRVAGLADDARKRGEGAVDRAFRWLFG